MNIYPTAVTDYSCCFTRQANVAWQQKFRLAKNYKFVVVAHCSKEVRAAALGTAAAMKWMKWIGRSLVERAAAALSPTCVDAVLSGKQFAAQISAAIGQSKLRVYRKIPNNFFPRVDGNPSASSAVIVLFCNGRTLFSSSLRWIALKARPLLRIRYRSEGDGECSLGAQKSGGKSRIS